MKLHIVVQATQRSDAGGGGEDDVVPSQSSLTSELKEASRLLAKDKERSGVPGFECSVCLNRPIQVRPCYDKAMLEALFHFSEKRGHRAP